VRNKGTVLPASGFADVRMLQRPEKLGQRPRAGVDKTDKTRRVSIDTTNSFYSSKTIAPNKLIAPFPQMNGLAAQNLPQRRDEFQFQSFLSCTWLRGDADPIWSRVTVRGCAARRGP
jgi:hypothetical protein